MASRDWHDLLGGTSISTTAISGALSSVVTKTLLFPVDTVKCRIQSGVYPWAIRGIFNGLIPKIAMYAPYQAIYMGVYTATRDHILPGSQNLGKFAVAGIAAELAGSVVRVPMEAIKQRMQAGVIPSNQALWRLLIQNPFQFYLPRNFLAQTLVHDIPCGTVHWMAYEYSKRTGSLSAASSGAVAGVITAVLTNPFDVIKTRMITKPDEHRTVISTIKIINTSRRTGGKGFFAGVVPRALHLAPNSALYMLIFDAMFKNIERLRGASN